MNYACQTCQACVMECLHADSKKELWMCKECGSVLTITQVAWNKPDKKVWKVPLRYQLQPARPLDPEKP